MTERDADTTTLSDAGRKRREAMLPELLREMKVVHSRRRMRRRAGVVASLGLVIIAAVVMAMPRLNAPSAREVAVDSRETAIGLAGGAAPGERVVVNASIIRTDPSVAERSLVRTGPHRGIILSDGELLEMLETIGRPAGLVRTNGKAWLTTSVAD